MQKYTEAQPKKAIDFLINKSSLAFGFTTFAVNLHYLISVLH